MDCDAQLVFKKGYSVFTPTLKGRAILMGDDPVQVKFESTEVDPL